MANDTARYVYGGSGGDAGLKFENSHDSLIWDNLRSGDQSACAYIYIKFFPVLYAYGCRMCGDKALVQDCIQDLFLDLSKSRNNLSETSNVRYYLYRCMRRKISLKLSRLHRYRLEPLASYESNEYAGGVILPLEFEQIELESSEEKQREILRALKFLTRQQRKVIRLRFYEDMSYKEISAAMSIHINTVYNLISMATASLRSILKRSALLFLMLVKFFVC